MNNQFKSYMHVRYLAHQWVSIARPKTWGGLDNTLPPCEPDVGGDYKMVTNLITQAMIQFGNGFKHREHQKHTTNLLLEGLQHIFDGSKERSILLM